MTLLGLYEQSYFVPTADRGNYEYIEENRKQEYGETPAINFSDTNNMIET